MDTLTHALSGALLARATEPRAPRPDQLPRAVRMWVGFWAAAFPDSDFVLSFIDPMAYVTAHRGITHSVILLPLWACALAFTFAWIARRRYSWRAFAGTCALGIGAHIAGDVITAFGTMVFAPVSALRVAWPTTFIIDPYVSAIIVIGLAGSAWWGRTRAPALAAFGALAMYVGFQGLLHQRALGVAAAYAGAHQLHHATLHALPQPFTPFHWMIVVEQDDGYRLAYISLARTRPPAPPATDAHWWRKLYAVYRPPALASWTFTPRFGDVPAQAPLARDLWGSDLLAAYRRFALLPALYRVDRQPGTLCVWFNDLRFALPGREMPFRYGACRDDNGPWQLERLRGAGPAALERVPH